jgi:hypothetical protein
MAVPDESRLIYAALGRASEARAIWRGLTFPTPTAFEDATFDRPAIGKRLEEGM